MFNKIFKRGVTQFGVGGYFTLYENPTRCAPFAKAEIL